MLSDTVMKSNCGAFCAVNYCCVWLKIVPSAVLVKSKHCLRWLWTASWNNRDGSICGSRLELTDTVNTTVNNAHLGF